MEVTLDRLKSLAAESREVTERRWDCMERLKFMSSDDPNYEAEVAANQGAYDQSRRLLREMSRIYRQYSTRSIAQFLEIPLPAVPFDPDALLFTCNTNSTTREYPLKVQAWPEFNQAVGSFRFPETYYSVPMVYLLNDETTIDMENDVGDVLRGLLRDMNRIFLITQDGIRFKGKKSIHDQTAVNADYYMYFGNVARALFEFKTPWGLPCRRGQDLVQMWYEDQSDVIANETRPNRSSVRNIIMQVYGYLRNSVHQFGVLSCYNVTYFLYTPHHRTLFVSDPVYCTDTEPTLLQSLFYFSKMASGDISSPEAISPASVVTKATSSEDDSPATYDAGSDSDYEDDFDDSEELIDKKDFSNLRKRRKICGADSLRRGWKAGEGAQGQVFVVGNDKLAIKVVDIMKDEKAAEMMKTEVKAYQRMMKAGIDFVPEFYFVEQIYSFVYLCIEYIKGRQCDEAGYIAHKDIINEYDRRLRRIGIKHLDLRPENVILTQDGKIKLIDFGLVKFKTQADDVLKV